MSGPTITPNGAWRGEDAHLFHNSSPELGDWMVEILESHQHQHDRIYDFGCGVGYYLGRLRDAGFTKTTGWEFDPPRVRYITDVRRHDLTEPARFRPASVCISFEVGEHIAQEHESTYLDTITHACASTLILSWAVRGQPGDGHVNCLDNVEVIERFAARGFVLVPSETAEARNRVMTGKECLWFGKTLFVFRRQHFQIPSTFTHI